MSIIIFLWKLIIRIPRRFHGAKLFSILLKVFLFNRIRVAKKNIKLCFKEMNKQELRGLFKENLQAASLSIFDMGIAWFWSDARIKKELPSKITNLELIKNSSQGNLIIFKHSLHLELDARILGMQAALYGVGREHNSPYMHKIIDSGRKRALKDTATKKETLRFIKWLKKGKNVLYAIDQDYGIKHSKKINFFGIPTFTITTAERLQEITNCNVVFLDSWFEEGVLRINLEEISKNNAVASTEIISQRIESSIRRNPGEYLWHHKRFKSSLGKEFYKDAR